MNTFLSLDKNLLIERVESLRIPFENRFCPLDWKDWYHYILISPNGSIKILLNVCLNGRPGNGEIQLSIVVTLSKPSNGASKICIHGNVICIPWKENMVYREPIMILASIVELKIHQNVTSVSLNDKQSNIKLNFIGEVEGPPVFVNEKTEFGSGFIGWGFIPKLIVNGSLKVGETEAVINKLWYCYHDHNFGQFRWGEDIGWEWLVVNFKNFEGGKEYQFVFDQRTNKNHSEKGVKYIFFFQNNMIKKIFLGNALKIKWERSVDSKTPIILPGTMASAFSNQFATEINAIRISAKDDRDSLKLQLNIEKSYQFIVPDNQQRQYTIMEEVSGNAGFKIKIKKEIIEAKGFMYGEFVR